LHNYAVPLSGCNEQLANSMRFRVDSVNFNNSHIVLIELQVLGCKSTHVDDTEKNGLVGLNRKMDMLCFVDQGRVWDWFGATVGVIVVG